MIMKLQIFFNKDLLLYVIAFLVFLSVPPYFVWNVNNYSLFVCVGFIIVSFLYCKNITKELDGIIAWLMILLLFMYLSIFDGSNLFGFIFVFLLCFILIFPSNFLCDIFDKFVKIYAFFLIPSIFVYFLVVIFKFTFLPSQILEAVNEIKDYYYIQYPFLVIVEDDISIFRFMAYFDEPGVVGTISGVLLLVCNLRFDKWETYPIIISGIISLSFAFYIMLLVYLLLSENIKVKVFFLMIGVLLAIYFANDDVISKYVFDRFKIEDGQLAGVNRTVNTMDVFMERFIYSDKFWFGYGNNYAQEVVNVGGASYKDLIVNYGIIGFILFVIISLAVAYRHLGFSKNFFLYLIIFGSIVYQRPFIFIFIYFFLLYVTIYYLKYKENL